MYNDPNQSSKTIDQNDLQLFRTITIVYIVCVVGAIPLNFITSAAGLTFIGPLVSDVGTLALAYGIIMLSRKYPTLATGFRVGILFIINIALSLLSTIDSVLYPISAPQTGASAQDVVNLFKELQSTILIISIISILSAIIVLITAYYFTQWFNPAFAPYNPTKTFLYYGIFDFIGTIILVYGEYGMVNAFANLNISTSGTITAQDLSPILGDILIVAFGGLLAFIGVVFLLVASFKIYYRVNDKLLGKVPANRYQPGYQQPYGTYPQQPYGTNHQQPYGTNPQQPYGTNPQQPYGTNPQQPTQNYGAQNPTYGQASDKYVPPTATNAYCKNCGAQLQASSKFCSACGAENN